MYCPWCTERVECLAEIEHRKWCDKRNLRHPIHVELLVVDDLRIVTYKYYYPEEVENDVFHLTGDTEGRVNHYTDEYDSIVSKYLFPV